MEKSDKDLRNIVSIIKKISPEKIYLFGSYATDSSDEQSDIDLLIIAPSHDRPLERRLKLRKMLAEYDRKFGLDLLIYTPDEFEMLAKETSSFICSAIKQGIKIYDHKTS
jgi:predicted nucleotidyltransferase